MIKLKFYGIKLISNKEIFILYKKYIHINKFILCSHNTLFPLRLGINFIL
jgi:hypothetical protein